MPVLMTVFIHYKNIKNAISWLQFKCLFSGRDSYKFVWKNDVKQSYFFLDSCIRELTTSTSPLLCEYPIALQDVDLWS